MTDEEFEKQCSRIKKLADEWLPPLGLRWWTTDWEYERGELREDDGTYSIARTVADWRYLEATVRWSMPQVVELDDQELENVFVHECCHILVNEMRSSGIEHEERVASTLAKAFIWLRDDCMRRFDAAAADEDIKLTDYQKRAMNGSLTIDTAELYNKVEM